MIVPSIDLMDGQAVQLIGGKERALEAGDPRPLAERFGRVGDIAVIDLDAALGQGDNRAVIEDLLTRAPCRVGGGIRSAEAALDWLDAGADKVILGTAATPEVLSQLPRDRVIAALDAVHGEVVVDGWRTKTGANIADRMAELRPHVGGFLVTFVEKEGRMGGTAIDRVAPLREAAGDCALTIAGGVTTAEELAALDAMGVDAQVGMALYTGKLGLAEAFSAPLTSDRSDGLWATVVADSEDRLLGQCWSNLDSLDRAIETGTGVYWSRKRGLWEKGKTSGNTQRLLRVVPDCDRDALKFVVEQTGAGFCHLGTESCWGDPRGLRALERTVLARRQSAPEGSYTRRLFEDPELLAAKLTEEAGELADALRGQGDVAWEAADVVYFTMVALAARGLDLGDVGRELDRRAKRVRRRGGDRKDQ